MPLLQKKGLNVVAAQLPLTSVDADIAVTNNLLAAVQGQVVLVGHSYGGVVIFRPPDANGFLWIDRDGFAKAFAADVDPTECSALNFPDRFRGLAEWSNR
jgi:hypothetical protein